MRPFTSLVSKEDALSMLLAAVTTTARTETRSLLDARGDICAEDVAAPFPVPPFDRATMDGYALRASEGVAPRRVVGDAFAGAPLAGPVDAGCATRIATGAPLPSGADAVVRVEDTAERDGIVTLHVAPRPRQCIDPAGADLAAGAPVVRRGDVLTPARLGLLASVGRTAIRVLAPPRVTLAASGDELLQPGEAPSPGRIYDSNTTTLRALLEKEGARVETLATLPDDITKLREALRHAASTSDIILLAGGASVGAKDLSAEALRAEGEAIFHGVRIKPGKPLLAGRVGACLVIGVPGNPASALTNAALFVAPCLRRIAGRPEPIAPPWRATMASRVQGDPERFLVLPVKLEGGLAHPTFKGSGSLTSLAGSDGWIGIPEGSHLEAGASVAVHPW